MLGIARTHIHKKKATDLVVDTLAESVHGGVQEIVGGGCIYCESRLIVSIVRMQTNLAGFNGILQIEIRLVPNTLALIIPSIVMEACYPMFMRTSVSLELCESPGNSPS